MDSVDALTEILMRHRVSGPFELRRGRSSATSRTQTVWRCTGCAARWVGANPPLTREFTRHVAALLLSSGYLEEAG